MCNHWVWDFAMAFCMRNQKRDPRKIETVEQSCYCGFDSYIRLWVYSQEKDNWYLLQSPLFKIHPLLSSFSAGSRLHVPGFLNFRPANEPCCDHCWKSAKTDIVQRDPTSTTLFIYCLRWCYKLQSFSEKQDVSNHARWPTMPLSHKAVLFWHFSELWAKETSLLWSKTTIFLRWDSTLALVA